jgi:hypothetical protein
MNGEAVKELIDRVQRPVEIGDVVLAPNNWTPRHKNELTKPAPKATALTVATLGAVRDYLVTNRDVLALDTLIAHVESPTKVSVSGRLREGSRDREVFIVAQAQDLLGDFLSKFMEFEDFNIGVQTRFVDADRRGDLLKLISNVTDENVRTSNDDGVSQVMNVRAGVMLRAESPMPNPVQLTGYRTFRDVNQPSALFVLRVQEGPEIALFEGDGGAWRLGAIEAIGTWLKTNLPTGVAVLA